MWLLPVLGIHRGFRRRIRQRIADFGNFRRGKIRERQLPLFPPLAYLGFHLFRLGLVDARIAAEVNVLRREGEPCARVVNDVHQPQQDVFPDCGELGSIACQDVAEHFEHWPALFESSEANAGADGLDFRMLIQHPARRA